MFVFEFCVCVGLKFEATGGPTSTAGQPPTYFLNLEEAFLIAQMEHFNELPSLYLILRRVI